MNVTRQFGEWLDELMAEDFHAEEIWYAVTMAPGGGPNGGPFIAIVLTIKSPVVGETHNIIGSMTDYCLTTKDSLRTWLAEALDQLRKEHAKALGGVGAPPGQPRPTPPSGDAPGVSSAARLYMPGQEQQ